MALAYPAVFMRSPHLRRFHKPWCLAVALLLNLATVAWAAPACPDPVDLQQPDGAVFKAVQVGDENSARLETEDGFTITQDAQGRWVYADQGQAPPQLQAPAGRGRQAAPPERFTGHGRFKLTAKVVGRHSPGGLKKHLLPSPARGPRKFADPNEAALLAPAGVAPLSGVAQLAGADPLSGAALAPGDDPAAADGGPSYAPTTVTAQVVVLLISFTNKSFSTSHTQAYYQNLLFNEANAGSLRSYYREVSYQQLDVTGTVAPAVVSDKTMEWYGADDTGIDDLNDNVFQLAREAVVKSNPNLNFANFDLNGDGRIDHLIVVHAGGAQESSGKSTDIWSHAWAIQPAQSVDGVTAYRYTMLAEGSPVGTFAHEFAHDLGLPDLYNTSTGGGVVGRWDLMDQGSWNNSGHTPAHLTAWCKIRMGWLSALQVGGMLNTVANRIETNAEAYKLSDSALAAANEYFLVENRQKIGFDAYLPRAGLLVWHIDNKQSNNNGTTKMVLPENAGGNQTYAPFSSTWGYPDFNAATSPSSRTNGGAATTVYANDIGASGDAMPVTFYGDGQRRLVVSNGSGGGFYNRGAVATISAPVPAGYSFLAWTGEVSTVANVNSATTTVLMEDSYTIAATFWATPAVQAVLNYDWVYQNTPETTGNRHVCLLTVMVTGPADCAIAVTPASGPGLVTIEPTADPLVWHIRGGWRQPFGMAGTGAVTLNVTATPPVGSVGATQANLVVRSIGDIDGQAGAGGQDKLLLNKCLNGLVPDGREFDLDALNGTNGLDKLILNRILNGVDIP